MTDWSALGGNPVPGDPGGIRAAAGQLSAVADKVGQQSRLLQSVSASGTSSWQGPAAGGFRSLVGDLTPVLQSMITSHQTGADALTAFASELQAFQAQAEQVLGQAQQAVRVGNEAQAQVESLTPHVVAATSAYNQAASLPPPVHPDFVGPVAEPALESAYQNMTVLKGQLGSAQQTLSQAQGMLSSCRGHAGALYAQANAAAQRCADQVNSASNWAKVKACLGGLNDKAGWALNGWGVYGAAVTSDKVFNWVEASRVYQTASAAEAAKFKAWNPEDGGWFAWNHAVNDQNAARTELQGAKSEYEDSLAPAASDSAATKLVGRVGLGAGMASDVVTFIDPSPSFGPDGVLGGNTDRVMASVNFAASGVALGSSLDIGLASAAMAIPGVDVVVGVALLGTAAYFAGTFVYQHWDDITTGVGHAADWVGHTAERATDDVSHALSKAVSWL